MKEQATGEVVLDVLAARQWLRSYIPLWPRSVIATWIDGLGDDDVAVMLDFALGLPYDVVRFSVLKKEWQCL